MFRTFINIRDGKYYLPTFTAATSSPLPFSLSSGSVLSSLVCPHPWYI